MNTRDLKFIMITSLLHQHFVLIALAKLKSVIPAQLVICPNVHQSFLNWLIPSTLFVSVSFVGVGLILCVSVFPFRY